jgi:hypothetical protein
MYYTNRSRSISGVSSRSKVVDNGLYLNLNDMYSIEENNDELMETRIKNKKDLIYEIKYHHLSEYQNVERRLRTEESADDA